MKTALILLALAAVAFSAAVQKEEKKPEPKPTERPTEKPTEKPAEKPADKEKPAEKPADKPEEKPVDGRLQWPLPDQRSEGDLMLHGSHLYDRVEELRKAKVENDVDKMILAVGRDFLRKIHKYLEATPDFKLIPALCRDTRDMENGTRRWEIRLQPEHAPAEEKKEEVKKEEQKKEEAKPAEQPKPQSDTPATKTKRDAPKEERKEERKDAPKEDRPKEDRKEDRNATEPASNVTEAPLKPEAPVLRKDEGDYETRRVDFYRRLGDNFARLLLKNFRKEKLSEEERRYIENWSEEAAIHWGVVGIYCHEGENVKDLIKKIKEYIDDKQ